MSYLGDKDCHASKGNSRGRRAKNLAVDRDLSALVPCVVQDKQVCEIMRTVPMLLYISQKDSTQDNNEGDKI